MPLTIPNVFTAGQKAKAGEVNENFDAVANLFNVTRLDLAEYGLDGSLTIDKFSAGLLDDLDVGASRRGYAEVLTEQTRSNASFGDLTTVGPQVTVDVPSGGLVFVFAEVETRWDGGDASSIGITEATDIPATEILEGSGGGDDYAKLWVAPGAVAGVDTRTDAGALVFPATAGTRTYKLVYRIPSGTGFFKNRKLWVWTVGNFS